MSKKMLFVYNPKAGKSQIKYKLADILDIFAKAGYDIRIVPTGKKGDAEQTIANRDRDYDLVVCSGGDGTLDETVTGMIKSGFMTTIGYIPAGSTNDFGGSLQLPKKMLEAAEVAANGNVFACDIGTFNDDVFVYIPNKHVVELADKLLAFDGCMNFFAGPTDNQFKAEVNMYNVHYTSAHIMGTTGGNNDDLIEANTLAAAGKIEPAVMVTHVGGIDSIAEATLNLPKIPGGKKLTYTQFDMPLTAIEDFEELGKTDPLFKKLDEVCKKNRGLWSAEAEKILFEHFHVEA